MANQETPPGDRNVRPDPEPVETPPGDRNVRPDPEPVETPPGGRNVRPDPEPASHPGTSSSSESVKQAAQQHAYEAVDKAKHQMQSVLSKQKQAAAGQLDGIVKALHATVEQLRKQDQSPAADYVERVAEGLSRFSSTVRERDIDSLGAQVQDFARRQPGMFLGVAAAVGFMAARFLRSSSASTSSSMQSSSPDDEPYAGTSIDEPDAEAPSYSQSDDPDAATDPTRSPT